MDVQFVLDVLTLAIHNTVKVKSGGSNTHLCLLPYQSYIKCGGIALSVLCLQFVSTVSSVCQYCVFSLSVLCLQFVSTVSSVCQYCVFSLSVLCLQFVSTVSSVCQYCVFSLSVLCLQFVSTQGQTSVWLK